MRSAQEQLEYLAKGAVEIISEEEAKQKFEKSLRTGIPLKVKVGFDPTAPDLHLGHAVLLRKMKHFQDLGHRVIFLIGDFTASIGDPTGRSQDPPAALGGRNRRQRRDLQEPGLQDPGSDSRRSSISTAAGSASSASADWIRLASRYTVARMLERDDFTKRLKANQPISIHELLYPLAQAYDSVALEADFEFGGTDQKFNLLVGRDIMREYGLEPQVILTTPLLEGTDGVEKMSKSLGNYIGFTEPPEDIFGKIMSISDPLMLRYCELLTDVSAAEIAALEGGRRIGRRCIRWKLKATAWIPDGRWTFTGKRRRSGAGALRAGTPAAGNAGRDAGYSRSGAAWLRSVWWICSVESGLAPSKTEARRLIKSGAVSDRWEQGGGGDRGPGPAAGEFILRCGKLRFSRIRVQ